MKKIRKIVSLMAIFIFSFYNTCFADLVWTDENGIEHPPSGIEPPSAVIETEPVYYILVGLLVLIIVVCAIFIIRRIIKKKKEKENDNK